jgi:hypothetical protein
MQLLHLCLEKKGRKHLLTSFDTYVLEGLHVLVGFVFMRCKKTVFGMAYFSW